MCKRTVGSVSFTLCFSIELQMKAIIDKIYSFDEMPLAFNRLAEGHIKGKVVIDFDRKTIQDIPKKDEVNKA